MTAIELCAICKQSRPAHWYGANGKRISKSRFEFLSTATSRTDTVLTLRHGDTFKQFKTVYFGIILPVD